MYYFSRQELRERISEAGRKLAQLERNRGGSLGSTELESGGVGRQARG